MHVWANALLSDGVTTPEPPSPGTGSQFGRYWAAAAISSYGTAVTSVAMPVLVLESLHASPVQASVVNAAQLVPYAALGLVAGVYVDRWRRQPVLVWASIGRAVSLASIPALFLTGHLTISALVIALLVLGSCSVFGFAATQSLLPRLVPRDGLVRANARLDQTDATSMTLGPALAGVLVRLVGAPVALLVDAVSYLVEAVLVARLRVHEPRPEVSERHLLTEVREGLAWTYHHPVLGRLAVSTHIWFLANGVALTTLQWLALRTLGMGPTGFAVLLATLGVATLVGASLAPALGKRSGAGRVVFGARTLYAVAWLLMMVGLMVGVGRWTIFAAQALLGLAAGAENSNEMALWQSATPDRLMGRVNASRRSVNRTIAAAGAVLAGLLIESVGPTGAVVAVAVVFALAALVVASPRVRDARPES